MDNPNIKKEYRDESKKLYAERYTLSTPETFVKVDWNMWMNDSDELRRANSIDYAAEFANMVTNATSEEDLVNRYNAWLESQKGIIQPALDVLNK